MTSQPTKTFYSREDQPPSHSAWLVWMDAHPSDWSHLDYERQFLLTSNFNEPLTDADLTWIEHDNTADEVPPCRVCGRALSPGRVEGRRTTWMCSSLIPNPDKKEPKDPDLIRDPAWDPMEDRIGLSLHHVWSEWWQTRVGDPLVLRLVHELRRLRVQHG